MIRHSCPDCQHLLNTAEVLAGMAVACPHCRSGVRVPRSGSAVLTKVKAQERIRPGRLTDWIALVLGYPILVGIGFLLYLGYHYFIGSNIP